MLAHPTRRDILMLLAAGVLTHGGRATLATVPDGPQGTDVTVGSAKVLTRLWTPEDLAARPGEGAVVHLKRPDRTPPERLSPRRIAAPLAAPLQNSIRRVRPADDGKRVALTFDLCEQADDVTGYDGAIVDNLRAGGTAATFFAGGKWLRSHPERAMQLIADPLFEVGNHAWTHGNLRVLTGKRAREQILWTQAQYELVREAVAARAAAAGIDAAEIARIPAAIATVRFPYGTCSAESLAMTAELGLPAIQWDVVSGDAAPAISAARMARHVTDSVRPGSIAVFHANGRGRATAAALPDIVSRLAERGYRFVTISGLLTTGAPVAVESCYEERPGDNARYDRLFGDGTGG